MRTYIIIGIISLLLIVIIVYSYLSYLSYLSKGQIKEAFLNNTYTTTGQDIVTSFAIEKCDILRSQQSLQDGYAEALQTEFLDGLRLTKFKPKHSETNSNIHCFLFNDKANNYYDLAMTSPPNIDPCTKQNPLFSSSDFIKNVYSDTSPTDMFTFDLRKCVLEIDPSKVNDNTLSKFWSNVASNDCSINTQGLRNELSSCQQNLKNLEKNYIAQSNAIWATNNSLLNTYTGLSNDNYTAKQGIAKNTGLYNKCMSDKAYDQSILDETNILKTAYNTYAHNITNYTSQLSNAYTNTFVKQINDIYATNVATSNNCFPNLATLQKKVNSYNATISDDIYIENVQRQVFTQYDTELVGLQSACNLWYNSNVTNSNIIYNQLKPTYASVQQQYANVQQEYATCQAQLDPYTHSNYPELISACKSNLSYMMTECNTLFESIGYYKDQQSTTLDKFNTCQNLRNTYQKNYDAAIKTKNTCYSQMYNNIYTYGTCKSSIIGCLQDLKVAQTKINTLSNIANVQQHTINTLNSDLTQCRPMNDSTFNRMMDVQYGMAVQSMNTTTTNNKTACDSGAAVATLNAQYQGLQAQIQIEKTRLSSNITIQPNCGAIATKCGLITFDQCPTPPTSIQMITPSVSAPPPPPVQIAPPPPVTSDSNVPPPQKTCIISATNLPGQPFTTNVNVPTGFNNLSQPDREGHPGINDLTVTASNGASCAFTGYEFPDGSGNHYSTTTTTTITIPDIKAATGTTGDLLAYTLIIS